MSAPASASAPGTATTAPAAAQNAPDLDRESLPTRDPAPDPLPSGGSSSFADSADGSAESGAAPAAAPDVRGWWHDEDMSLATTSAAMVGRDAELALLDDALRRAGAGESASVLVGGEAGIGKSRLTAEFRRRVADEVTVLTGWCLDYGSTPAPFGPLPAILRGLLDELGDRADEAAGPGRDALQLLLPERATGPVDRAAIRPEGLRETIANLLEAASAIRPVVVVIEDLHWADAATLSMLSFLLRALAGRPVLFLLTCRIDEVRRGGGVRTFLAEAERARLLDRVTLKRLDAIEVRDLVQRLRGAVDDAGLARLMERSEGVPFFIEELLCNVQGPMPDTLRDVLLSRFDALGDDAKRIVRLASGSDDPISHDLLTTLAGFDGERLDDALREAMAAGVLAVRGDSGYGFRHALLREAVHDDLLPGERARLHWAYADALEAAGGSASALAFHWHQSHDSPRALAAAVTAMLQAKNSYAFSTSARFGELALELWDQVPDAQEVAGIGRIPLLAQFGSILRNGGDGERALAVVSLALDEIDPAEVEPAVHARLLRDKGLYLQNLGRHGSVELLTQALSVIEGRGGEERLRATLLGYLAGRYLVGGQLELAVSTADEAYRVAERIGFDGAMSVAGNLRGCARVHLGQVAAGLDDFRLSWQHATDHDAQLRYRVNYADTLNMIGRFREAVEVAEAGVAHSRRLGVERATGSILSHNMVEPLIELGEIARAEEATAHDMTMRTLQVFRMYSTMSRIRTLVWRGGMDEAAQLLREWRTTAEAVAGVERQVWYSLHDVEILIALGLGDPVRAAAGLRETIEDPGQRLALLARILLEGGRVVADLRADGHAALAAEMAGIVRSAWSSLPDELQHPHWAAVLIALLDADGEQLDAAIAVADGDDVPAVFRPLVRLERARVLVADGDRGSAIDMAAEAAASAEALGHDRLRRRTAEFIDAAGLHRAGSRAAHAAEGVELTAREQQVLDLIAEGLSNRQIGERLFISGKTASVHVSAILRKLGVSSRTEAAVAQRAR
ncbi:AAA family ATPase [Microbacterium sp.]|jgi:DNA-binding NarL/FixJ family response regulator|uniref:helix-turn-helix transcriptional regulator n=1 Tax=Microbacterium sp. TaxID=51671 RepID=UPI002852CFBA|nr:AAA family ATPase [Microbacterium sp.]